MVCGVLMRPGFPCGKNHSHRQTKRASGVIAEIPVVSCCTVNLEPRQQTVLSMRTKDRSAGPAMVFEAQGLPRGILLSKTPVEPGQRGGFYVRAVNYSTERVTVFKNQKLGVVEPVDEFVELPAMPEKIIKEAGLLIWSQLTQMKTRESTVGEAGARIL